MGGVEDGAKGGPWALLPIPVLLVVAVAVALSPLWMQVLHRLQFHSHSPPGQPYQSSRHLSGAGPSPGPCTSSVSWPNHCAGSSFLLSLIAGSLPFPLVFQLFQHPPNGSSLEIPSLNSWQALSLSDWPLADPLCLKPVSIKHEKFNFG